MNANPAANRHPNRRGSAIVTVMLVVVVTMMAAGSLFAYSTSTTHRIRIMTEAIRAKAIAEAGANRGYDALRQNYGLRTMSTLYDNVAFADGNYTVTLEDMASGWTRLVSVGTFGRAEHRVGLDMRNSFHREEGSEGSDGGLAFLDYAIFVNGATTVNGTPKQVDGSLHSNGSFVLNGTYANVNGKVSAPEPNAIPASHKADWKHIHFPSTTEFRDFLDKEGIPYNLETGSMTYHKDHVFNGITIVTGSVTFRGSGTREINGILYVGGSMTANGSTTLTGSLMVGGSLTINGASAVLSHEATIGGGGGSDGEPGTEIANVVAEIWWD